MWKQFWTDLKTYLPYSRVSARAQLRAEVANSRLNRAWWVLEPLCFMLVYTFIFGYVFNASEKYFPVFIFTGLAMWDFMSRMFNQSIRLVKNNRALVTKVYFPKYILLLTKMWVNGFKMLIALVLAVLLMVAYRVPVTWNVIFCLPVLLTFVLLTFGCSCYLMHFGVYVEDLSNVVRLLLRFAFYATGIFYDIEKRIPHWGILLNRGNPIAFLITAMRQSLLYGETPDLKLLGLWLLVALLLCALGIRKIYWEENSYVKSI